MFLFACLLAFLFVCLFAFLFVCLFVLLFVSGLCSCFVIASLLFLIHYVSKFCLNSVSNYVWGQFCLLDEFGV